LEKLELLKEGKAKKLYTTEDKDILIQEFKDNATAFDGIKKGTINDKGELNCGISTVLFQYLESYNVPTHLIKRIGPREQLVKNAEIIQVEVVMRNYATGSLVKRLPFEEGKQLVYPILELYYKNDELGDPLINEYHAYALKLCQPEDIRAMLRMTSKVNAILKSYFERRDLMLIDFKLEFGRIGKDLILADEISPDTCRIWDKKTRKKLDKDRFRFDMGGVEQAYKEVLERIENS
jgi:phosphoribosylaminoimidazole-succinocarboxamide synthase